MISNSIFEFLNFLKENNTREWFHANKALYEKAKNEFEILIGTLIEGISEFDEKLGYLEPKDCSFRIYRDIRFSKDKTPYKPNFGAYMVSGGKKSGRAGYYIHFQPGESFLAGGIYMPSPEILKVVRKGIYDNAGEFLEIVSSKSFVRLFGEVNGEKSRNVPSQFPKEFEYAGYLKFKSYNVMHYLNDKILAKDDFTGYALKVFREMHKFNSFLNGSIDEA